VSFYLKVGQNIVGILKASQKYIFTVLALHYYINSLILILVLLYKFSGKKKIPTLAHNSGVHDTLHHTMYAITVPNGQI